MSRHVVRPIRYTLSTVEFLIMGSALSVLVAIVSVAFTLVVFGGWR